MKCFPASLSCKRLFGLLAVGSLLLAGGCSYLAPKPLVAEAPPASIPELPATAPNGAIYQPGNGPRPLFEDLRPEQPGDLLTVVFNEQVNATRTANSSANRKGETSFAPGTVPKGLKALSDVGMDIKSGNSFQGGGSTQANNTFTGTITVTVMQVLPNGNLRVHGEKRIAINKGTEYIRFAGVVDPRTISADNSVQSTKVADARIEYVGDGYISDAQRMGWLQRILLDLWPF